MNTLLDWLALLQGIYYALTGIWPLVSIGTFLAVTGPKRDLWLVRTVGVLVLVIGAALIVSAATSASANVSIFVLAVGSALGLTAIDVIYVLKRVISPIYLLDAAAEVVLIVLWIIGGSIHG